MKLLTVVGARPQFIKAAVLARAFADFNASAGPAGRIVSVLAHTGQHYDENLSGTFFQELAIPKPDYHLGIGSGAHGQQTGRMLEALERVMVQEQPEVVLVYGDTNSTLAGALASAKLGIPVAHVEAGLRSHNRAMPEELNRVVTDHLSALLFCPTALAVKNLGNEGIVKGVHLVGDVMVEAMRLRLPAAGTRSALLEKLAVEPRGYYLVTVHRAENTDEKGALSSILQSLAQSDRPMVFPCHPRTRKMIEQFGLAPVLQNSPVRLIEPVSYVEMLCLEAGAALILTDSGGVQKEAYWLGVPCVTLRNETEWVETLESGWNILAGTSPEGILPAIRRHREGIHRTPPFDLKKSGEASRAIITHLLSLTGGTEDGHERR